MSSVKSDKTHFHTFYINTYHIQETRKQFSLNILFIVKQYISATKLWVQNKVGIIKNRALEIDAYWDFKIEHTVCVLLNNNWTIEGYDYNIC